MNDAMVLQYSTQALWLALMLSMPAIVVAAATGFLVSLFQSLTQIQDQTLSFAFKLVAVAITLFITIRWMGSELILFGQRLFDMFPGVIN